MANYNSPSNKANLTGQRFSRLVVVEEAGRTKAQKVTWHCQCECGNTITVATSYLKNGNTQSCGCLMIDRVTTHGKYGSKVYKAWQRIIQRCNNVNFVQWKDYGGRGIKICARWLESFDNFYADMGDLPSDKHTIERIDNNGDYEPDNCKWDTMRNQRRNARSNRLITFNGETLCMRDWETKLGFGRNVIAWRLDHGWSVEKTLTER